MLVDLQNRHVLITGGTGFLGKSVLDHILNMHQSNSIPMSFRASLLSRRPDAFLEAYPRYKNIPWLEFVQGDINNIPKINRKVTDVIHGAADTHSTEDRLAWLDQLVNGTRSVLEFSRKSSVHRFLLLSSGAIYGLSQRPVLFREDDASAPLTTDTLSIYAHGKRMAETLCSLYGSDGGMECVIARCFTFINQYIPLVGAYAAGNFIRDALDKNTEYLILTGNPETTRSFMDGRDAAKCLIGLLLQGKAGEAYNVGSDDVWPMQKFAQKVLDVLAPGKSIITRSAHHAPMANHYTPNIDKLRGLLGEVVGHQVGETLKYVGDQILNGRIAAAESSC